MSDYLPSPSAIALGQMCLARAVARYTGVFTEPESPQMRAGKHNHELVQLYLRTGAVPAAHEESAHAAIRALPIKAGSVHEHDIERPVLLTGYQGWIDWTRTAEQGDLKFTGNMTHVSKKDPFTDPQRVIYAADAFYRLPSKVVTVISYWTVATFWSDKPTFKGCKSKTLAVKFDRLGIKKRLAALQPIADEIVFARKHKSDWQSYPKNLDACSTYRPHGCPLRSVCKVSLADRLISIRRKPK